jgi:hypothetical protein
MKRLSIHQASYAMMVVVGLAVAVMPALARAGCELCSTTLGDKAVVVTDWETNREHRYHDLSCAANEMAARFPWSRAATQSAASGERITLTHINTTWRAEPEQAVAVILTGKQGDCQAVLAFASTEEFQAYRQEHKDAVPADAPAIPLDQLPARVAATGAAGVPAEGAPAAKTGQPAAKAEQGPSAFADVPADHWAAQFVEKVKALGLMQGYPDGTFRGDKPLSRYEMAAVLAMLAERGLLGPQAASGRAQTSMAEPSAPKEERGAITAEPEAGPRRSPAASVEAPTPSLLGTSGLLSAPSARIREAGSGAFAVGSLNGRIAAGGTLGLGSGFEVGAATARLKDEDKIFLTGKVRLAGLSRPGLDVAAGLTGIGSDTSAFAVATKLLGAGRTEVEATVGIGTGGILDGPFAGAAVPINARLHLYGETADLGKGREFNYGLDLALRPNLDLRVGHVDGRFAAALLTARGF